jgi:hypothetical protein
MLSKLTACSSWQEQPSEVAQFDHPPDDQSGKLVGERGFAVTTRELLKRQ